MSPFHVIIPARYQSGRLPGKPLMEISGKPMVQHVMERAQRSDATSVVIATDDSRIEQAVKAFGGDVVMTSTAHESGSDRIAEAATTLGLDDDAIIVNVQGDEPDMPPSLINQVAELLANRRGAVMATACAPLEDDSQLMDPSVVKVVTDKNDYAIYFSRATIPWVRSDSSSELADNAAEIVRRHLGIYAYRSGYIQQFASRSPCYLEQLERLEQLRALWHGERIACCNALDVPGPGVDTLQDLENTRKRFESQQRSH